MTSTPMTNSAYFPPPESQGGWRTTLSAGETHELAGVDLAALERAWGFVSGLSEHSSLLVVRHGWLCFERYQGLVYPTANRDLHSCGKAFTSTAAGILVDERPDLFPERLDQRVYSGRYLPPEHAPLHDARKRDIVLGQLLSHTAGLRGNNGATFDRNGPVTLDLPGPDGGFPDHMAFGHAPWIHRGEETSTTMLWCDPGAGYSYASAGPVIVGAMIRHLTGKEVADYLAERVFEPIGWEDWRWAANPPEPDGTRHTKAQGGIAPRPRDAVRFGYLHLHGGAWAGRQLVPHWYVEAMRRASPYNPHYPHYGLQVRINAGGAAPNAPADAYGPAGFADNYILIVPSLDLVVARIGDRERTTDDKQVIWRTILESVVAAAQE
ncbi:MAG: serine hydrolase [Chloroflexi bacterium]|nr:serine hydrolase [Chloroflexota bacterium]